ncbi:TPA: hypothetical protein N0G50_004203 [Pseudomonas aeruginosa]|nr:hypothetical protein [Pseudomonas aeruginosa]
MSIDWSTAPEGANKAGFTGHEYLQFYRIPGMFGDYDYWNERMGTWCGSDFPTCANHLFDRPEKVEWDGQGLPPVGIEAEVIWDSTDVAYYRVKILAHDEDRVVFRWCEGESKGQYGSYDVLNFGILPTFRPLRTPEQIAAEERRKSILHLANLLIDSRGQCNEYSQAEAIFDAGYRRQEEGK